jgi:hypothetical protein
MSTPQKICLSCKHFRPDTVIDGLCRINRTDGSLYPRKSHAASCEQWFSCGQQYYIRTGWVKRQLADQAG